MSVVGKPTTPGSGWTPVVGDWNGDGVDTVSYKANNNGSIIRAGLNYKF